MTWRTTTTLAAVAILSCLLIPRAASAQDCNDLETCMMDHCLMECYADPESADCTTCLAEQCPTEWDACYGGEDPDTDGDGVPDSEDPCPEDNPDDPDGDTRCGPHPTCLEFFNCQMACEGDLSCIGDCSGPYEPVLGDCEVAMYALEDCAWPVCGTESEYGASWWACAQAACPDEVSTCETATCPGDAGAGTDADGDGIPDDEDNCPNDSNADQVDYDGDMIGDICDPDADNDGWDAADGDCIDTSEEINPGMPEICDDGMDNDCDGFDDLSDTDCGAGTDEDYDGWTVEDGDCDDYDPSVNPGAEEFCGDFLDNNCDGEAEEGCAGAELNCVQSFMCLENCTGDTYCQSDCVMYQWPATGPCEPAIYELQGCAEMYCGDTYELGWLQCAELYCPVEYGACVGCEAVNPDDADQDGWTIDYGDCDDNDYTVNPGMYEVCDDYVDNNCDGQVDEGCGGGDGTGCDAMLYCMADCAPGDWSCSEACQMDSWPTCSEGENAFMDLYSCGEVYGCFAGVFDSEWAECVFTFCDWEWMTCADTACADGEGGTDGDGDGWTTDDGDCDDTNYYINPGMSEDCYDGYDNDCDYLVDTEDPDCDGVVGLNCVESLECLINCGGDTSCQQNCVWYEWPATGPCEPAIYNLQLCAESYCGDTYEYGWLECAEMYCPETYYSCVVCDEGGATDGDGDGWTTADGDCDDTNSYINPGMPEDCYDGWDNNCDGYADGDDPSCGGGDGSTCNDWLMCVYMCPPGDYLCGDACISSSWPSCAGAEPAAWDFYNCAEPICGYNLDSEWVDCAIAGECMLEAEACMAATCEVTDADGDGWSTEDGDCDDSLDWINPGMAEDCYDGWDNDCDGQYDTEDPDCGGGDGLDCVESLECLINCGGDTSCQQNCVWYEWPATGPCEPAIYDLQSCAESYCGDTYEYGWLECAEMYCPGPYYSCVACDEGGATDGDGDGWTTEDGDCDDSLDWINPGMAEDCYDGWDNDCDGQYDTEDPDCGGGGGVVTCMDGLDCFFACEYGDYSCYDQCFANAWPTCAEGEQALNDLIDCGAYDGCAFEADPLQCAVDMCPTEYWSCEAAECAGGGDEDADGDGWTVADGDCNDGVHDAHPGHDEWCSDGYDNDCDGFTDGDDSDCAMLDDDEDGIGDDVDNCRGTYNPDQDDSDGDGLGDDCDACPTDPDCDGDGVLDGDDYCPADADCDGDGVTDDVDLCDAAAPDGDADGNGCEDTDVVQDCDGYDQYVTYFDDFTTDQGAFLDISEMFGIDWPVVDGAQACSDEMTAALVPLADGTTAVTIDFDFTAADVASYEVRALVAGPRGDEGDGIAFAGFDGGYWPPRLGINDMADGDYVEEVPVALGVDDTYHLSAEFTSAGEVSITISDATGVLENLSATLPNSLSLGSAGWLGGRSDDDLTGLTCLDNMQVVANGTGPNCDPDDDDDGVLDEDDLCPDYAPQLDGDLNGCEDTVSVTDCDGTSQYVSFFDDFSNDFEDYLDLSDLGLLPPTVADGLACSEDHGTAVVALAHDATTVTVDFDFIAEFDEGLEVYALLAGPRGDELSGGVAAGLDGGYSPPELTITDLSGNDLGNVTADLSAGETYHLSAAFDAAGTVAVTISGAAGDLATFSGDFGVPLTLGSAGALIGRQGLTCADNLQVVTDGSGVGPECVVDTDGDGVPDDQDACPGYDDNDDWDGDGNPDGCDACPMDWDGDDGGDVDGDGLCDADDMCTHDAENDADGDGMCAPFDTCPYDAAKYAPGACGCGEADTDTDGDGTEDCFDMCPDDPGKTDEGICGCGVADLDSDGDLVEDCNDYCPADANKIDEGICGCGVADTDTDGDGWADCEDNCPDDAAKTGPGICGCGVPDFDTDADGAMDCVDGCPDDADKTEAGVCGCGVADTDSDLDATPDCIDGCADDADKTEPGVCGCGVADTDSDGDQVEDCLDDCPGDAAKIDPGTCGCGVADTDTDDDGLADCIDGCPEDGDKAEPGICGCGTADTDTDGDTVADCNDPCPLDVLDDQDGDGACDSDDACPVDPFNDSDGDGSCDSDDPCPLDADDDADNDGTCANEDICPLDAEDDADGDGICGDVDVCPYDEFNDADGDEVCGNDDVCPGGDDYADADFDGTPDFCDLCPEDADNDADNDGLCANEDACPLDAENDWDGDGVCGDVDVCPYDYEDDADGDGMCADVDPCPADWENDADGDGICESDDNCPTVSNANQSNVDGDEYGDACEPDNDGDGVIDDDDNCPLDVNADQEDYDGDGVGDVCDADTDGDDVIDADDECLGTTVGDPVLDNGCSWDQECECEAEWKNHGAYVSCVAHATEDLVDAGLLTEDEKDDIQSEAGSSECGHKDNKNKK